MSPKEERRYRFSDVRHEVDKHLICVLLVFDEGILLTPSPKSNGRFQVIQIVEVILPLVVQGLEHDEAHDPFPVFTEIRDLPVEMTSGRLQCYLCHRFGVIEGRFFGVPLGGPGP